MSIFNWGCSNVFSSEMEFGLSLKIIGILLLVVVLASSSSESEKKDNEIEDQRSVATL